MELDHIQPYLNLYEIKLHQRMLHTETIRSYLFDLRQYLVWLAGLETVAPEAISKVEAELYLKYLRTVPQQIRPGDWRCYSWTTIRRKIGVLADFYDIVNLGKQYELLP